MTVRMGYDLAMTIGSNESEATQLSKGQAYKNGIRVKRQQISEGTMILTPVSALHSRKKGGLKRYEKIRAERAL